MSPQPEHKVRKPNIDGLGQDDKRLRARYKGSAKRSALRFSIGSDGSPARFLFYIGRLRMSCRVMFLRMFDYFTAHSDAVIALSSAIVGALFGFFGSYWIWWLERRRQRRIAKMQIVINLRRWLQRTLYRMNDVQTWVGSHRAGGTVHTTLQNFRFEKSLEQVALLERQMAEEIFALIHKKDNANSAVEAEIEDCYNDDDDDPIDLWRGRCGQVWLETFGIYDRMSAQIKWSERAFSDENKKMMQEEIDRYQKLELERIKSNVDLFSDKLNSSISDTVHDVRKRDGDDD
jgi:hypothetical protein